MNIDSPNSSGISTGFGIPTGGTANQVLTKINSTNFNTQWIDNGLSTYIQAYKDTTQTIVPSVNVVITGFTNTFINNAAEWNATTGVFTATKASWYSVSAIITYSEVIDTVNTEYGIGVVKNGNVISNNRTFVEINQTVATFKQVGTMSTIVQLSIGDTISSVAYQASGFDRALHTNGNYISIQELPSRIVR
jgi:hypothetical protein